jgi:hypothetical protein
MSFYQRLRYSLYLTVVGGALVGLVVVVASADVVGLLPATAFDLLMPPGYLLVVFALAFIAAPMVARSFPITWEVSVPDQKNNAKNNYVIRLIIWAGIGVLLALLGNLLVYLLR